MPKSSITIAMNTPIKINVQGRLPSMTPSMIIFIIVAWGAASLSVPNPNAESRSTITPPIASAAAIVPMISPICCFLGVAPRI